MRLTRLSTGLVLCPRPSVAEAACRLHDVRARPEDRSGNTKGDDRRRSQAARGRRGSAGPERHDCIPSFVRLESGRAAGLSLQLQRFPRMCERKGPHTMTVLAAHQVILSVGGPAALIAAIAAIVITRN